MDFSFAYIDKYLSSVFLSTLTKFLSINIFAKIFLCSFATFIALVKISSISIAFNRGIERLIAKPPSGSGASPAKSTQISHSSFSTSSASLNVKIFSCINTPASTSPLNTASSISRKFLYIILAFGYAILKIRAFVVYSPLRATLKLGFNFFPFNLTSLGPYPYPKLMAVLSRAYSSFIN